MWQVTHFSCLTGNLKALQSSLLHTHYRFWHDYPPTPGWSFQLLACTRARSKFPSLLLHKPFLQQLSQGSIGTSGSYPSTNTRRRTSRRKKSAIAREMFPIVRSREWYLSPTNRDRTTSTRSTKISTTPKSLQKEEGERKGPFKNKKVSQGKRSKLFFNVYFKTLITQEPFQP